MDTDAIYRSIAANALRIAAKAKVKKAKARLLRSTILDFHSPSTSASLKAVLLQLPPSRWCSSTWVARILTNEVRMVEM